MFRTELEKNEYFDFVLTDDVQSFDRDFDTFKLFYVDVTEDLCSYIDTNKVDVSILQYIKQPVDITVKNISLTGYDNFLLNNGDGTINTGTTINIDRNDTFCLDVVSGYTHSLSYEIVPAINYNTLNGGFYQSFFKLHGYPVEFMPNRFRKGWTANLLLKLPATGYTTGTTTGETSGATLNEIFQNPGFVFYLGTRAENKYSDLTNVEIDTLKSAYGFEFVDTNNLYARKDFFTLDSIPYVGYYHIKDGINYAGRTEDDENKINEYNNTAITGNTQLARFENYSNIIDNAFGVRILPDGRVGYRNIYATDICYDGSTQDVNTITNNSFIDITNENDDFTKGIIITDRFHIEESYTIKPVINVEDNSFILFTITFERDFNYTDKCLLKYGDYKKGTLSIGINGFIVYKNTNFNEIIPHELDIDSKFQEGVPFNLSFGGGTQGIYESIYLDPLKQKTGLLEKFFAGTFLGGVKFIEMYSIPLYGVEIKQLISTKLQDYDLYYPKGGRRVFIKKPTDQPSLDIYSIYATTDLINILTKQPFQQIIPGDAKEIVFAGELNGYKQTFDIPVIFTLRGINYFNNLLNTWDSEERIREFTVSDVSRGTIQYKRYVYNKTDRGQILIKLLF
jgi:hypothetical protein